MKKLPTNAVKSYSAFALAFLGIEKIQSQIVYANPDPDLRMMNWPSMVSPDDLIEIDIDSNGVTDLEFNYFFDDVGEESDIMILYFGDAVSAIAVSPFDSLAPQAFSHSDIISSGLQWNYTGALEVGYQWGFSWWSGGDSGCTLMGYPAFEIDNFLGIKLNIAGETHYGWVRLSIHDFQYGLCDGVKGSPLTIYEWGYNYEPDSEAICIPNSLSESFELEMLNNNDADDFSEIMLRYFSPGDLDNAEVRAFIADNREDVINFSVEYALTLPPTQYVLLNNYEPGYQVYSTLPNYLLAIDSSAFDYYSSYSVFFMKIPLAGYTGEITLSSPTKTFKATKHSCSLPDEMELNVVDHTGTAADFTAEFEASWNEASIEYYQLSLCEGGCLYSFDELSLPERHIVVPKTGASSYVQNLSGLLFDVDGDPIIGGGEYHLIISAPADGYNADVDCTEESEFNTQLPTPISDINAAQNIKAYVNSDILIIEIADLVSKEFSCKIFNSTGADFGEMKLYAEKNTINLSTFSPGIYFIVIYESSIIYTTIKVAIN
ncbi:MAG: hypothetical protein ACHQFW_02420 [Chitinophagales bacterium]